MRILATSRMTDAATPAALQATMAEEIAVGKRLYAQGTIVEAYADPELRRTFMLVEAAGIGAAQAAFAAYPQVRDGLIAFEFTPLVGLPAIASMHREHATPLPAWWPEAVESGDAAAPPNLAADAVIVFADLQAGIVERARTIDRAGLGRGVSAVARLAKIFALPVVVTTVPGADGGPAVLIPEIEAALGPVRRHVRTGTDALDNAEIRAAIAATGRKTLIFAGVATEVAVQRPSLSGVRSGFQVQVVLDACGGISPRSEQASLLRLTQAGVVLTSVASLAGDLATDFTQPAAQAAIEILMSAQ